MKIGCVSKICYSEDDKIREVLPRVRLYRETVRYAIFVV